MPAGAAADDILLISAECNAANSLTTPTGYTAVTGSPFVAADCKLYLWWRRFVAGDTAKAIAGSTDHVTALIVCYSGAVATGTPFESVNSSIVASGSTAATFPVVTPTAAGYGIIHAGATGFDSSVDPLPSYVASTLEAGTIAKNYSVSTTGDGGGSFQLYGRQPGAATATNSTGTLSSTGAKALASLVLTPAVDAKDYVYNEQLATVVTSIADNQDAVFNAQMATVVSLLADNADAVYNFQMITVVEVSAIAIIARRRQTFTPG